MPGPLPKPEHRRQRRNKRRVIVIEPGPSCVICGRPGAEPFCSRRCERRLEEAGGAAKEAERTERFADQTASAADARAWRELAARLRAIA